MIIAFHTPTLTFRGSCVALMDYAKYNEQFLGNKSIIITARNAPPKDDDAMVFTWITNRFELLYYEDMDQLQSILTERKCDVLYCIKYGKRDALAALQPPPSCKVVVHCVFDLSEPHGDVYAGVSKSLVDKFGATFPFVPHMVEDPILNGPTLRTELGIPSSARVFGRHGGLDTFDLTFAKEVFSEVVRAYDDIYFVFLNAPVWDDHPQIIYLPRTCDTNYKQAFIRTCDAMVVPETLGHSFGLSIAEFSVHSKPILVYNGPVWNTSHLDILGDKGLYFSTREQLVQLITSFDKCVYVGKDLNAYREFTPEKVMRQFQAVFIRSWEL